MPNYRGSTAQCGDILINVPEHTLSHCGIVVKNRDVVHATGKGMKVDDVDMWTAKADVYRPRSLMGTLSNQIDVIARQLALRTQYGVARAGFKSWTSSTSYGSGAKARLKKYRARLAVPFADQAEAIVKHVYCSEFVVLCYQLSCEDDNARHFIKLDAKHTMPKNLRAYLKENLTYWEHIGQTEGS